MGRERGRQPDAWGHLRMFAITGDGVFAVDPEGRIVLWNRAATRILGFEAEEALGRRCCDVMSGLDVSGNLLCFPGCQVMVLSARAQPIHHFEMQTRRKDGQEIWLDISTIIVPADGDAPGGTVHLFRDITQERPVSGWVTRAAGEPEAGVPRTEPGKAPAGALTAREREILHLIAAGLTTSAIADKLCISSTTVRNHVQHILAKLGAHSRLEAVTVVYGQRLLATTSR